MNLPIKTLLLNGSIALLAGSLLFGCASKKPVPPKKTAGEQTTEAQTDPVHAQSLVVSAWVQAINPSKRTLTLKLPDDRTGRVSCGPEVQNFTQVQASDDVKVEFVEAMDMIVVDPDGRPVGQDVAPDKRGRKASKGKRAAGGLVKMLEITATVAAIDPDRRKVTFQGSKGNTTTVTAGPEVKGLDAMKPGDTVLARYLDVTSIKVTTPEKIPVRR
ncbi:hypothetical protein [Methylomagnum sp.]